MSATTRCLIVEPHPIVRVGLATRLEGRFKTEMLETVEDACELLRDLDGISLVLLGHERRGAGADVGEALEAIAALRLVSSGVGLVVFSDCTDPDGAWKIVLKGADAFVCKRSSLDCLDTGIESALRSERFVDPAAERRKRPKGVPTPRQCEVLQAFAEGATTDETAIQLGISPETVRTHAKAAISRIGASDRAHAIAIAMRHGLIS